MTSGRFKRLNLLVGVAVKSLVVVDIAWECWSEEKSKRPKKRWSDDVKDWTNTVVECFRMARDRHACRKLLLSSLVAIVSHEDGQDSERG